MLPHKVLSRGVTYKSNIERLVAVQVKYAEMEGRRISEDFCKIVQVRNKNLHPGL